MIAQDELFMIVPVWFGDEVAEETIERLLALTAAGAERYAAAGRRYYYIDGMSKRRMWLESLLLRLDPEAVVEGAETNQGKGAGVEAGLVKGLGLAGVKWLMVRDADGDHRAEDAAGMLELAAQMERECKEAPLMVVGGRFRLEPPLSLYRAVYEEIINSSTDAALKYALAKKNQVPRQVYYRQYRRVPDWQSGYKLYNRRAAEIAREAFGAAREAFGSLREKGFDAGRYGAELVPYVSVMLNGGVVGERLRSTFREQPTSAYASVRRAEFYAIKLVWVFETCGLSMWNAVRILDAELTYAPLMFDGMGRVELMQFREKVLLSLRRRDADEVPPFQAGAEVL